MEKIITKSEQQMISLKKIKANPLNTFKKDKFEDLKNSIITYGLITPISVIGPDEDDCYIIIAGEQRYHVYEELTKSGEVGFDTMPAYIVGDVNMSETEQKLLIEASNLDTRDLEDKHTHYFNVVKLMKQLAEEKNLNKKEYVKLRSDYLKCSVRYARFYEQIFNSGNQELQDMVANGEVSVSRAGRIATMSEASQEEAIEDIKAGMNQDDVVKKQVEKKKAREQLKKESFADDIPESEIDMFDPFSASFENNDEFSEESLLNNMEDFDFDEDIDFTSFNTSSLNCNSVSSEREQGNKKDIRIVLSWCEHMKKVSKPTDEEWEALEACKAVVNKFM